MEENTRIGAIENFVITEQISFRPGGFKVGDDFQWEGTLSGKTKITQKHLDDAQKLMIDQWTT